VKGWVYRVYLVCGAAVTGAGLIVGTDAAQSTAYGLLGAAAGFAILTGLLRYRPRMKSVWYLIFTGILVGLGGDVLLGINHWLLGDLPVLSLIESLLYLSTYPFLLAGLSRLVRSRTTGRDFGTLIDAAIMSSGLALLAWVYLVAPVWANHSLTLFEQVLWVAYPLFDVALVVLLARLVVGTGARSVSLYFLAAYTTAMLAADASNAILVRYGSGETWGTGLYCLSYLFLGAAALHPSMPRLAQPGTAPKTRLSPRRLAVLTLATLIAPLLLIGQAWLGEGRVDAMAIGVASMVLFLLVVARMAGLIRRVEEQAQELSGLASRDGLTGVLNRRSWDTALPLALDAARRTGRPLSVALVDLDHFKRFNDTYGHQAGDRLLKSAAAAWGEALRTTDVLYRYGGEEFGLVLAESGVDQAIAVVERLRVVTPEQQTFSAGVACWDGQETAEHLVARADAALYAAKTAGRNRTAVQPMELLLDPLDG
jgi:diguanylate cyclase (GGDEF)-like protein